MKKAACYLCLLSILVGCSRSDSEQKPDQASDSPALTEATIPEISDEAISRELDDLLSADTTGTDGEPVIDIQSAELSAEQRATLETAVKKAVGKIDLSLLSATGMPSPLHDSVGTSFRVLTSEEAKQMGIDPEAIQKNQENDSTAKVQVFMMKSKDLEALPEDGTAEHPQVFVREAGEDGQKIIESLNSGDSDKLSEQLSKIFQQSIDSAAIEQLLDTTESHETE